MLFPKPDLECNAVWYAKREADMPSVKLRKRLIKRPVAAQIIFPILARKDKLQIHRKSQG